MGSAGSGSKVTFPRSSHLLSQHFPEGQNRNVTVSGVAYPTFTVTKSFAPVRQIHFWHNFAPRMSATYALEASGRIRREVRARESYLDQIATSTPPNPNGTISCDAYERRDRELQAVTRLEPVERQWL